MVTMAGKWLRHLSVHCYIHIHKHSLADVLGCSAYFSQILDHVAATIRGARTAARIEHPISIALDEWNLWYHKVNSDNDPESEHMHVTALKDGVATACIFNTFHRHCQNLSMAHLAQTVNALPLIYARETPEAGMFVNPQYLAFKLYAHHTGELSVRSRESGVN